MAYYNRFYQKASNNKEVIFAVIGFCFIVIGILSFFGVITIQKKFKGFITVQIPSETVGVRECYEYTDPTTHLKRNGGSIVKVNGDYAKNYYAEYSENGNPIRVNNATLK